MNNAKNIVILIGVVVGLVVVWRGLILLKQRGVIHLETHTVAELPSASARRYVTVPDLKLEKKDDGTRISYHGFSGETALNLLRLISASGVATNDIAQLGTFVTSIDGRAADQTHYWALYINDHIATSSPDTLVTKDDDTIEWRYQSL
ncbi:DUF4430 domain-containing protein [Candidatus Berkelbacteria bacterium]|nr:DUF4430 domain-containing protein [Candidatus Berkelbacteria bacterium]